MKKLLLSLAVVAMAAGCSLVDEGGIPAGKKSMAFTFQLRADDHTLTDEEIGQAVNAILKSLKFRLGAELRA